MIAEVVRRRYGRMQREETNLPELLVVDGGAGQVAAARRELDLLRVSFPLIGLAKKNEEIYLFGHAVPLILPRTSPALKILQRARDEAHRFSHSYHLHLRDKAWRLAK